MDKDQFDSASGNRTGFHYGYVIVLCAFLSMFAIYSLPFSYGIFFKPMAQELGWNRAVTSGAYSLSRIFTGLVGIATGLLTDTMGARIVLCICGLLYGIGFFLLSRINAAWQLYLIYGVIIGSAISIQVPMVSTIAKWFVHRRTMMTGIVMSGVGVATLIGPPIFNSLIIENGWRLSYMLSGIALTAIVIIVAQFMKREPYQKNQGVNTQKENETNRPESHYDDISLKEAICTKQFWTFFIMSICFGLCYMAIIVHLVPHMTDLGISSIMAANSMATIGGASVVSVILMGIIGDKFGNKKTLTVGFILMFLAMLLLLFINKSWHFYIFATIFSFAFGCIQIQRSPLVATMFGVKSHGLIFGIIDNSFTIGAAIGPVVYGYIFDTTGSYQNAFLISSLLCILGFILIVLLNPHINNQPLNSTVRKI